MVYKTMELKYHNLFPVVKEVPRGMFMNQPSASIHINTSMEIWTRENQISAVELLSLLFN